METSLVRKNYNIEDVALATFLFVVFTIVFQVVLGVIPKLWLANSFVVFVFQFLVEAIFAVVAYIIARNRKTNVFEATGMNQKVNLKMVGLAFLTSIVCLIFFGDLTNVFISFLNLLGYHSSSSEIVINSFGKYLAYVISLCIAPAIFEEMLFRGTILKGLKSYGPKIAILVSAAIFMIMHGSPDQTIHQFVIGILIGYVFFKTGNLWIGILIHFFNNFISVTELYVLTMIQNSRPPVEESAQTVSSGSAALSLVLSFVYALIFAVVGYMFVVALLKSIANENKQLNEANAGESVISVDGQQQTIELSVDGQTVSENGEDENASLTKKQEKIPQTSKYLFWISGILLVGLWLLALSAGFK